jgi:hypothetical protein
MNLLIDCKCYFRTTPKLHRIVTLLYAGTVVNCAAAKKARVLISSVATNPVMPDELAIRSSPHRAV